LGMCWQMRTPNLKLSSSNHTSAPYPISWNGKRRIA
jgi:hypothetical protein